MPPGKLSQGGRDTRLLAPVQAAARRGGEGIRRGREVFEHPVDVRGEYVSTIRTNEGTCIDY
jgi:DhnA family fructose-bisphosphate aldolase class Ia